MTRVTNALAMRTVALAAAIVVLCVSSDLAQRQRNGENTQRSSPAPASRPSPPRNEGRSSPQVRQAPRQDNGTQFRQAPQPRNEGNFSGRPQPNNFAPSSRPGSNETQRQYNGDAPQTYGNGRQPFVGARPNSNGTRQPYGGPHLQDWLNRNSNSTQDQEKQLRSDPSFKRLPQADQQRLTQQLRSVDRMPEQQRDRRLARNEMLERLSPEERMSINRSGRDWSALPADRQTQMRRAFQDLRDVPPDQRQTVLNSSRYQNMFTPQERGILSDFLKVEPYEAPQR